jgi:hypothetical protein
MTTRHDVTVLKAVLFNGDLGRASQSPVAALMSGYAILIWYTISTKVEVICTPRLYVRGVI